MITRNPTDNAIIEIITKQGTVSMDILHEQLKQNHNINISLSQLYLIIKQMREAVILKKNKSLISFNQFWVQKVQQLSEQLSSQTNTNL